MAGKVIVEGCKIELQHLAAVSKSEGKIDKRKKVYHSLVTELLEDNRIKIIVPFEDGKMVPLPTNSRFFASFYTSKGIYQARVLVLSRSRENNAYVQVVELISDLKKFQRRQYYRLACMMNICYKVCVNGEETEFEREMTEETIVRTDYHEGTALDISGGGIRFTSREKMEEQTEIFLVIDMQYQNENIKRYGLNARIISAIPSEKQSDLFEYRAEYIDLGGKTREALIRYIFEAERKQRQALV